MMANIHFIEGDLPGTLDIIDQQIRIANEENDLNRVIRGIHLKGWYAMQGGMPELALDIFTKGLNIIKSTEEIKNKLSLTMWLHGSLSLLYGELGMIEKAEEHLNEVRKFYRNNINTETNNNFYCAYEAGFAISQGDYKLAINQVQVKADRGSIACAYYTALAFDLAGNHVQAKKYYNMALLSVNPYFSGFFFTKIKKKLEELSE